MQYNPRTLQVLTDTLPSTKSTAKLISALLDGYTTQQILENKEDLKLDSLKTSSLRTLISRLKVSLKLQGAI